MAAGTTLHQLAARIPTVPSLIPVIAAMTRHIWCSTTLASLPFQVRLFPTTALSVARAGPECQTGQVDTEAGVDNDRRSRIPRSGRRNRRSEMRRDNGRNLSKDPRRHANSAEQRETLRQGLRILARVIARTHLCRQASGAEPAPSPSIQGEGAG